MARSTTAERQRVRHFAPVASLLVCIVGWLPACESTAPPVFIESEAPSTDGLRRIYSNDFAQVWLRADVDWSAVELSVVEEGLLRYREGTTDKVYGRRRNRRGGFRFPPDTERALPRYLVETMVDVVDGRRAPPSKTAARIRVSLVDVFLPTRVDRVPPEEEPVALSAGAMTLVFEVREPETQRVIARILDRRPITGAGTQVIKPVAGPVEFESRRVIRTWAEGVDRLLDRLGVPRA